MVTCEVRMGLGTRELPAEGSDNGAKGNKLTAFPEGTSHNPAVFDILEPGHDSLGMNCSNIGDYLDVASAHDQWKDSKTLMMPECRIENSWSLDMGFDRFPMKDSFLDMGFNSPPVQRGHLDLDIGFHSPLVQHRDPDQMSLDMGFNSPVVQHDHPEQRPSGVDPVDIPDQSVGLRSEETSLDMGFGTDPAHDLAHHLNIQPEETPLEMGFETLDLVHGLPYQSSMVSELEPMGFVIQHTVGDLHLAIHWLEMERAHGTMSPEEALVSEEVLQATIHSMKCDDYALCM
ncbi:uncharacterized protein EDB93DRAFT_1103556 [Suillus bovinus]|uniref:uncharacterized protein n=1 Tax=Suillus bovinus TaxID=48563 RepID=UPI001B886E13|nr:uncharacterized protein EDB93DRAFT_1103556 [Suillus bovinus]KAG2150341.1 hypothetical protein EDB93DRAFT_1103556 [Suillus bovinus]